MDLLRIAARVASPHRRVSLESIMETVQKNCPTELRTDVGKFLGSGYYGEAYNADGTYKLIDLESAKILLPK